MVRLVPEQCEDGEALALSRMGLRLIGSCGRKLTRFRIKGGTSLHSLSSSRNSPKSATVRLTLALKTRVSGTCGHLSRCAYLIST